MNVSVASDASLLWMVVMSVGDVVVVFVLLEELGTNRSDRVLVLFGVIASPKDLLLLDAISREQGMEFESNISSLQSRQSYREP